MCYIPLSRNAFDYTRFDLLFDYVRRIRPALVINAAGFMGKSTSDTEMDRMQTFQANTVLPQTIARVCTMTNTVMGHVSSGCIYTGAKIFQHGRLRVERDLSSPELLNLFATNPEYFFGFTELDEPNSTFRAGGCSFLAGTKALAEESLSGSSHMYVWRARVPFSEVEHSCNVISKLKAAPGIYNHITSLSHVDDFVRACLDLVEERKPFGTYNVANPGAITIGQIVESIWRMLKLEGEPLFLEHQSDEPPWGAKNSRAACLLDTTKIRGAGIRIRPVGEALEDALANWKPILRASWPSSIHNLGLAGVV
jgi:dTDP-4-dehydrorhamnose reductase